MIELTTPEETLTLCIMVVCLGALFYPDVC